MVAMGPETGITREQAAEAGLLHDVCKALPAEELLARAGAAGVAINAVQHAKPGLLHGPVAAETARRDWMVDDHVYDAIFWHTTGRPEWCHVGLVLYFADFAEPLRTHPESAEARRRLAARGFPAALRYVCEKKLAHIRTKPHVDPMTEAFHAWVQRSLV